MHWNYYFLFQTLFYLLIKIVTKHFERRRRQFSSLEDKSEMHYCSKIQLPFLNVKSCLNIERKMSSTIVCFFSLVQNRSPFCGPISFKILLLDLALFNAKYLIQIYLIAVSKNIFDG